MVRNGQIQTFAGVMVLIAITGPSAIFTISRAPAVGGRPGLVTVTGRSQVYVQLAAVVIGALVECSALALVSLARRPALPHMPQSHHLDPGAEG
jgi:threonine/homoserine/homoserine lactone efflux protein